MRAFCIAERYRCAVRAPMTERRRVFSRPVSPFGFPSFNSNDVEELVAWSVVRGRKRHASTT